jgi:hypothetical protein
MVPLLVRCLSCRRVFPSGFDFGPGTTVDLQGNLTQCPHCGSWNGVPDGTFSVTLDGLIRLIQSSASPLQTAQDLQKAVRAAQSSGNPDTLLANYPQLRAWVPTTPEKAAAYITIIAFLLEMILRLLGTGGTTSIDVRQVINIYNQAPQGDTTHATIIPPPQPTPAEPSRNAPCPCGSGRTFKNCHGRK